MPLQKSFQNSDHLFPESSDIEHTRAWLANTSAKEISDVLCPSKKIKDFNENQFFLSIN